MNFDTRIGVAAARIDEPLRYSAWEVFASEWTSGQLTQLTYRQKKRGQTIGCIQ